MTTKRILPKIMDSTQELCELLEPFLPPKSEKLPKLIETNLGQFMIEAFVWYVKEHQEEPNFFKDGLGFSVTFNINGTTENPYYHCLWPGHSWETIVNTAHAVCQHLTKHLGISVNMDFSDSDFGYSEGKNHSGTFYI